MMKLPTAIKIILKTYGLGLLIFFLFRLIQFSIHIKEVLSDSSVGFYEIVKTFLFGLRYDLMITSYLLILPFLLLVLNDYFSQNQLKKLTFWLVFILFIFSFLFTAADIPYYNKFYSRLSVEAFTWFNDPLTVFGMVFQEVRYWFMFIPLLLVVWVFRKLLVKIFTTQTTDLRAKKSVIYYLGFLIVMFFSMRGAIIGAPLRYRDAFTGKNVFLNSLKLNPVFTLEKSYEESLKNENAKVTLMPEDRAIANIRGYFNIKKEEGKSPIARQIKFDTIIHKKKNVVLVLMESMASWKMAYHGNTEQRTPFLDSLFRKGISFSNIYSNGIHTYCGVFGTNYSFPMFYEKHPMTQVNSKKYEGLPYTMKQNGYNTTFFIPGSGDFDNMYSFLQRNYYDTVYTKADYPKEKIVNIWGVTDRYLLDFALDKINIQSKEDKPFFTTILTISDHGPFRFSEDFISDAENERVKATQFADWSLQKFMKKAVKQDWFDNTIFVFVADHGEAMGLNYKIPLTYNKIPIIYYYKGVTPTIIDKLGSQLDVFPTLMGLLQMDYTNNTFGIDLLNDKREYVLFNHDKEYGVIGDEFLLIVDRNETIGLYKYQSKDKTNYAQKYPDILSKMEDYYKSHIQTSQYMLDNNLQFFE